jgi:bifunctional non-homologous end joining protein LigD
VARARQTVEAAGRGVVVTNPQKVYFPATGHTKGDLIRYYLSVADGAIRGIDGRPMILKRFVNGVDAPPFYQKRVPGSRPDWIETVELRYPSKRTADEVVVRDAAQLLWVVNLGCVDLNPHSVRADDTEHPDELRIDLDPVPGVTWPQIRDVALVVRDVLHDLGLTGWPKTSGSRGFHVFCRIERRWTFPEVRLAALAIAREVERRAPDLATSRWWKEERHGVFVDFNQNARDHTVASAYSVRPTPGARVSAPLRWDEVPECDPAAFTIDTVPPRHAEIGDPHDGIDEAAGSLEAALELAAEQGDPDPRRIRPLIEIARAGTTDEAMAALERWRERHADVWPYLRPNDVLVDAMRGRFTTWTRIRINLEHVPEEARPEQEPLEVDFDPWAGMEWGRE